jgi:hypothetical protein
MVVVVVVVKVVAVVAVFKMEITRIYGGGSVGQW